MKKFIRDFRFFENKMAMRIKTLLTTMNTKRTDKNASCSVWKKNTNKQTTVIYFRLVDLNPSYPMYLNMR